ncbi:MAG: MFS transporter, partial [Muribaculaceae bacterium]|nr:MFS transporter [Muribaculaceae bacterium]
MTADHKASKLGPFVVLTFIYFVVGFLTTVNGQFQGPLKVAFLSNAHALRNTLTTMISFFFFLGYLVNSSLGGKWIDSRGYKTTLLRALVIMIAGLALYSLSSFIATQWGEAGVVLGEDLVPWGYFVFLLGSFFMGTSAAILQVVINPYIAAYDLPGTKPVQRMNIVCAINSIGTTIAPFFVTGIIFAGVAMEAVTPGQLMVPFLIIAGIIMLVTGITSRLYLPDIKGTRSEVGEKLPRSVWSFRHLALGVVAIF